MSKLLPLSTAGPLPLVLPPALPPLSQKVLLAIKTKKMPKDIAVSRSIKDFAGGKSTLQNEILGDLQSEFGSVTAPEPAELPLKELAGSVAGYSGGGKFSKTHIARLMSAKMPAGYGMGGVRGYLGAKGFKEGSIQGILLHGLAMEPTKRLGSDAEAVQWLDGVVQEYSALHGVVVGTGSSGGVGPAAVPANVDVSGIMGRHDGLIQEQVELYARYLGRDLRHGDKLLELQLEETARLQAQNDLWVREHGEKYSEGIAPRFTAKKVRHYDSAWNWAKQDVVQLLLLAILRGPEGDFGRELLEHAALTFNRSDRSLLEFIGYETRRMMAAPGPELAAVKPFGYALAAALPQFAPIWSLDEAGALAALAAPPRYLPRQLLSGPSTEVTSDGSIRYREVPRPGVSSFEDFVAEIGRGFDLRTAAADRRVVEALQALRRRPTPKKTQALLQELRSLGVNLSGKNGGGRYPGVVLNDRARRSKSHERPPLVHLRSRSTHDPSHWAYDRAQTNLYLQVPPLHPGHPQGQHVGGSDRLKV